MPLDLSPVKHYRPENSEIRMLKTVLVEYLYLDLQVCNRCIGTEQVLEEVLTGLSPALHLAGYTLDYRKIKMETPELARQYQFESSPTVRVNGRDVCFKVQENLCDCCSDISGSVVNCRVFVYEGQTYEVPPKEMLAEAILKGIFWSPAAGCCTDSEYKLAENLEVFYKGKHKRSGCC